MDFPQSLWIRAQGEQNLEAGLVRPSASPTCQPQDVQLCEIDPGSPYNENHERLFHKFQAQETHTHTQSITDGVTHKNPMTNANYAP